MAEKPKRGPVPQAEKPGYAETHRIARPYKKNEQAFIEAFTLTEV